MSQQTTYTIGELARLAGVTPRTIRYYTAEGLLPPPDSRGQYAQYTEDHLLRLHLIARLKRAFLPLGEIKARIAQLAREQIRQLLAEYEQADTPALSSAAEYLAQVMSGRPGAPAIAEARAHYEPGQAIHPPAPAMHSPGDATALPAAPAPPYGYATPAAAPAPGVPDGAASRPNRLLQRLGLRAQPAALPADERWRRIVLMPGVELHVREPVDAALLERVAQLIEQARSLIHGE